MPVGLELYSTHIQREEMNFACTLVLKTLAQIEEPVILISDRID
jgi:hypothetical protein